MIIELNKKQIKKVLDEYINETMCTEEFEDFIVSLARRYKKWYQSDINGLIEKIQGKNTNA